MASSRRRAAAALLLASSLAVVGAAGADEPPLINPVLGDPAAVAAGRKTYRQRCYICHLSQGGRGPNLFESRLSDEKFLMTVINGRKGATMPAFGLQMSPDEVWQVHAYVHSTDHYE
jgi:mono/diheme cytochrome c family protein